jgi:carbonic anhydrase/acetyltransferase-like protein (isoleucine patch superfamily)
MPNIRPFAGTWPDIAPDAWVDETAVVIGDVHIGARSSVWPGSILRGDIHAIRIGADSNIQDGSVLHVSHDSEFLPGGAALLIGNRVTVGHKVILHGCEIGDDCLIGMGAIIMDRAVLQPNVVVGAGSVVPGGKLLESGYLYVGAPARRVRELTEQELEYFGYSADHYVRLAGHHRTGA